MKEKNRDGTVPGYPRKKWNHFCSDPVLGGSSQSISLKTNIL
ncbi:hypothetical protein LEP1GSC199_2416 [Leptospira vanthielii serovar Holland str. Waz Holland = ATCC 700522]|uniref:Uncharacterized protein n=1 Tax=Leptospira vanthielii serovar Holland str. Waz Holland = ATCC 700522 TaxID=1218591 RepID=N1W9Q3_9LEPT|nr:hypothetical protein LEP1GSC199_2416 [Leptospira vanthielii serovar Holland str. Waz Holland = ATCC 700522]